MKRLWKRLRPILADPALRPVEVWAIRAAVAYVAVKLGVDAESLVK